MKDEKQIGILGGGSWGTAMVSLFTEKGYTVNWWMRSQVRIDHITQKHHNPDYLSYANLNPDYINFSTDVEEIIQESDILIIAIPGAFVDQVLSKSDKSLWENKLVVSAVKGIINNISASPRHYFEKEYKNNNIHYSIVSGPSHAEEIVMQKLTFLTLASEEQENLDILRPLFETPFTKIIESDDVDGIELASILKNAYAVATGIIQGLAYGDNFKAVFVSNCLREMKRCLKKTYDKKRDFHRSVYSGDLLVTSYSNFSRNLNFGIKIGKGYSVEGAIAEMRMISEGFYVLKNIQKIIALKKKKTPILLATYNIIFDNQAPWEVMKKIERVLV